VSRAEGITDEELGALAEPAASDLFSEREKTALAYAEAIAKSNEMSNELFERVQRQFREEEIIELTATITWEICAAKFNRALEIEWGRAGTCPLPRR
jgi:alkylhydroperoxidase family enzyme